MKSIMTTLVVCAATGAIAAEARASELTAAAPVVREHTGPVEFALPVNEMRQFEPIDALPGTTIEITLSGSGDADLYTRFGTEPTRLAYGCRPYLGDSNEHCSLLVPAGAGPLFLAVNGYRASQVAIEWSYVPRSAHASLAGSVAHGELRQLGSIELQPGSRFIAEMSALAGDPDLFVRFGAEPDRATYDCRPWMGIGHDERCAPLVPLTGSRAFVAIDGYSAADFELDVELTHAAPIAPDTHGLSFDDSVEIDEERRYGPFQVADRASVDVRVLPTSGDPDLFVRWDGRVERGTFDCFSRASSGPDVCTMPVPPGVSSVEVLVLGYSAAAYTLSIDMTR